MVSWNVMLLKFMFTKLLAYTVYNECKSTNPHLLFPEVYHQPEVRTCFKVKLTVEIKAQQAL